MFKIGEFSKLSQVSVRMLRYYDEQGLLLPAAVDRESGYRFYHVSQLAKLQKIILLKNLKFSTVEIKELVEEELTEEYFQQQLKKKYRQIEQEIMEEQQRLLQLAKTIEQIEKPMEANHQVIFRALPKEAIVSLRKVIPSYYHEGPLWQEFMELLEQEELDYLKQAPDNFTVFHDECYLEEGVDIEICLKLKAATQVQEPLTSYEMERIPLVASIFVVGSYDNIQGAYHYFAEWLAENEEYEMEKPTRQVSHRGPDTETDPENYLTEIQIPIKKIS
ncbi:MerR family transcriptional regulator [Enterococcus sp. BWM-S5]|uniref:MerR family transcriptional regulator n=1 Tax=Enterococcus larvae TaxID=2794352 RepID=A0ABS4CK52_9ENTE|nr:MerR family transcriptional regulator [Enterococcus larvae]MBP1046850.1 MerR family transcriptional regulator [Enterococcus larvae]